ncbi:MAG: terminase family protein [Actinomycetota bacterium]|nr:terminase family protein [Actinomycetota bacterium]
MHISRLATDPEFLARFLSELKSPEEGAAYWHWWEMVARDKQLLPPGDWSFWLTLAGRGWGKTRTGAETIRIWAEHYPRLHLIAETAADARDTMVEGESGILRVSPPWFRPVYQPSKRQLTWPNGAIAKTFSAEDPDQLRGPQCHKLWAEEVASWRYAQETWDMAMFGLRLGDSPQAVVTTTPRPIPLVRQLRDDPRTVLTVGSTYENRANLAEAFFSGIITRYEGTRLGRQELLAELLEDTPGALWTLKLIDEGRVSEAPDLIRIVVAVDPPGDANTETSECGITVGGISAQREGYLLEDCSLHGTPAEWGKAAVDAYHRWGADKIVGEVNNGGEMVGHTIRTATGGARVNYEAIRASRGKLTRAEPVSALYEQDHIHHVGAFKKLEDQMTTWTPGEKSPDRMDALVWLFTELLVGYTPSGPAPRQTKRGAVTSGLRKREY